jgi:hypothetical protein
MAISFNVPGGNLQTDKHGDLIGLEKQSPG